MAYEKALNAEVRHFGHAVPLRQFFRELLLELWSDPERFSGKRPFGDSGWDFLVYEALIREGFISGTLDEDGRIFNLEDERMAHAFVSDLILAALRD